MKTFKQFIKEAEEPALDAAPPKKEKKKETPTSLFKGEIKKEKEHGLMIYDKILNIVQVLQYDDYKDIEKYFDVNEESLNYIANMKQGDTNEDESSILTIIW